MHESEQLGDRGRVVLECKHISFSFPFPLSPLLPLGGGFPRFAPRILSTICHRLYFPARKSVAAFSFRVHIWTIEALRNGDSVSSFFFLFRFPQPTCALRAWGFLRGIRRHECRRCDILSSIADYIGTSNPTRAVPFLSLFSLRALAFACSGRFARASRVCTVSGRQRGSYLARAFPPPLPFPFSSCARRGNICTP